MTARGCVLLTGGAGYVGSHVNKALAEGGVETVVVDDLSTGHRELARWGHLEIGSILDAAFLDDVFARHSISAVMHFAGKTSVAESVREPELYHRVNVEGSACLLEAMRQAGVGTIVFSSSAAVYGHPDIDPIPESAARAPINPYGRDKAEVEDLLASAAEEWGLSHVSLRYFNAAGAAVDAEIGEWHDPETHLIPLVLDAASGRREAIEVFGDDYETRDGTCVRDYVHVVDLAEAHLLALAHAEGGGCGAYNLGTGGGSSVFEVIAAVREVTGRPVKVDVAPRRAGDPPSLVADSARARAELGWAPKRESLTLVVEDAWRWHQKRR